MRTASLQLASAQLSRAFPHHTAVRQARACILAKWLEGRRGFGATQTLRQEPVPLRKHLKDEAKQKKIEAKNTDQSTEKALERKTQNDDWELTVGIEIHAELNTACKLFSTAAADGQGSPNSRVAEFDAALPGSQPLFQKATLLPALRAALALNCQIQRKSSWDRKHYFHWDQPNGYQITQYYEPFARDGSLSLTVEDGVPATELNGAESVSIGIKQIQMEQDTAKTTHVSQSTYHVDLNRNGLPLIEIITLPHIHSPQTAAATVRKIQAILKSVDACIIGMEFGGLRADVNVSVRKRGTEGNGMSYSGVSGLGQRTEIKNLSSFKAVEDAIIAERDRQISILEEGGVILGETRGWSLGANSTTRLRGKEGEVDYRYMPDPDLPPFYVGPDLVEHLRVTLPELPDASVRRVQDHYGLTAKDARTLVGVDNGDRLEFMEETITIVQSKLREADSNKAKIDKTVANWVLHEMGGLMTAADATWNDVKITPMELADIVANLLNKQITARVAKQLLVLIYEFPDGQKRPPVDQLIDDSNLRLRPLSDAGYIALAAKIMDENPNMVAAVRDKGQKGKIMWFVGQMVRRGEEGTVEPETARRAVEKLLQE